MQVRPGISITVQYGLDLQACEIRVHTTTTSLLIREPDAPMLPEILTEIINEIAPIRSAFSWKANALFNLGLRVATGQRELREQA
jgi:hypothetical protein